MIAICNTLSYSNVREQSDIDLFIITSPKRIWLTRFWAVAILDILNLRPKKNNSQDKFCLSIFTSSDNLNFEKISLKNDIYLNYWLTQLIPIYDQADYYHRFIQANQWFKKILPRALEIQVARTRKIDFKFGQLKKLIEKSSFNFEEKIFKKLELKFLAPRLKDLANQDTRVILSDQMLKFHDNDRREYYQNIFNQKLNQLNINL